MKHAKTQQDLATSLGTSRATIVEAARDASFPKRSARGWPIDRCRKWFEVNERGPYRRSGGGLATTVDGLTLNDARRLQLTEQTELLRINKASLQRRLEADCRKIIWPLDFEAFVAETRQAVQH